MSGNRVSCGFPQTLCQKMNPLIAITPAILLLGVVVVMILAIFQFDRLRWSSAKDFLGRFWSADRRRVLHLEKQNGFFFFVDLLIDWLSKVMRFAWILVLPALSEGVTTTVLAALIISGTYLLRFGSLTFFASKKVRHSTMPLEYDGYGVYARSASDWRSFKKRSQHPLIISAIFTLIFIYALFDVV